MNGVPWRGPSPRRTDTRARLSLAGRKTFLVPSERNSVSSYDRSLTISEIVDLENRYLLHQYKLCIDGDQSPRFREFVRRQEFVFDKTSVSIAREQLGQYLYENDE